MDNDRADTLRYRGIMIHLTAQEGSKIGVLGYNALETPKIVGVASECQESRSVLASEA